MRSTYDSSFLLLKERVEIIGDAQPQVSRPPRHDDEELGPSIFRLSLEDVNLAEADLRGSVFEGCEFTDAVLTGATLFRKPKLLGLFRAGDDQEALPLSTVQRAAISWSSDIPSPGGG